MLLPSAAARNGTAQAAGPPPTDPRAEWGCGAWCAAGHLGGLAVLLALCLACLDLRGFCDCFKNSMVVSGEDLDEMELEEREDEEIMPPAPL